MHLLEHVEGKHARDTGPQCELLLRTASLLTALSAKSVEELPDLTTCCFAFRFFFVFFSDGSQKCST